MSILLLKTDNFTIKIVILLLKTVNFDNNISNFTIFESSGGDLYVFEVHGVTCH